MSNENDKAGLPLPQTKLTTDQQQALTEPLSKLEDQLHNLLASYRFYDCAIRHMTEPDHLEESDDWHFGLFLHQQYLQQQADKVMEELVSIKRLVH
jgi:dTDP-4-amino-4,6-dideoxygalactose transaminase